MQEAMLIELRVTTNNPPAAGQPASQPSWQALPLYTHYYYELAIQSEEVNMVGGGLNQWIPYSQNSKISPMW